MIVRDTLNSFVLVKQHDHAIISGQLAENWSKDYFQGENKREDVIYSVYQHDRGWIALDHTPFWNDLYKKPYSFIDFPLVPKLVHYKHGIDEVEEVNAYAALLCSLHFCALLSSNDKEYQWFISHEEERQKKLKKQLKINLEKRQESLISHLLLLQFCDHLSLYLCMNKPGLKKRYEFKGSDLLNSKNISAQWVNPRQVAISPFPFQQEFEIKIKYKEIHKHDITKMGLVKAYEVAEYDEKQVKITNHKSR
ncbi:DUF3891 family protein [Halalkalibacter okhensis]|uniref:Uncharacterized protein n=1 Tax=Halalkalibacter okhensis TaxID=333138 RepID=A0A0B0I6R3_9BACI|nr:DUF3891 family protein [Halalkalibacter okhensis]KHF38163.1 hypothetical protein LQ50_22920 [Halalkalibacter okhensis]